MTKFKKGDTVRVVRKFESDEGNHELSWMPQMDKFVGNTAKVECIAEDGDVRLDCGWWFYPFVLEHAPQFNVGDRVRQIGPSEMGFTDHLGEVGTIIMLKGDMFVVDWENGGQNNMPPESIEHVTKQHVAKILTEKVTVSGVPCRKILGFEGVLPCDELPEKYMGGKPRFFLSECTDGKYMFDGEVHQWVVHGCKIGIECVKYEIPEQSNPEVILDDIPMHRLATDEVYSEATFQAIVVWLKRAGSRLTKIRQQEKDAWSGKETIEI